jgi:4-amino-4-deoxy-L-arabinose transferase-like glycosyltransferase
MQPDPVTDPPPTGLRGAWREPEFRALAAAALIAFFVRLWEGTLDGDPVVYASVARNIADSGDWLSLRLGFQPYWNKPPLLFWLTAAMFRVFGVSTFTACFWPALFGAASVLAFHRLARVLLDRRTAFAAAFVLLATPELLRYASRPRFESISVFFLVLALLDVTRAVRARAPQRLARAGAWIGLLFLAKGGPGFVALAVVVPFLTWQRAGKLLLTRHAAAGALLLLVLAGSWPALHIWRHGDAYAQTLRNQLFQVAPPGAAENPWTFYPARLLRNWWLWLPFAAFGGRELWRARRRDPDPGRLVACWLVGGSIAISQPEQLYARYLTSLYPALALAGGIGFARALGPERLARLAAALPRIALLGGVAVACLPYAIHGDSAEPARRLGAVLEATAPPGAPVPVFGEVHLFWRGQFHFYLGRDVEPLPDLEAVARRAPPVLVARSLPSELLRAGWRPHIESWRWHSFLPPEPPAQAGASPPAVSRRLE